MTRPCRRVPARTGARHLHRPPAARATQHTSWVTSARSAWLVLASCAAGLCSGPAHAREVLPAQAQPKLQRALKPYAAGEPVVPPWQLLDIRLDVDHVAFVLVTEDDREATLTLVPVARGGTWTTPSFAASLDWNGEAPPALAQSVEAILAKVRAADRGDFFVTIHEPASTGSAPARAPPRHPIPIALVVFGLLGLAAALMVRDRGALSRAVAPAPRTWLVALGLFAVALALRYAMGAHTLLHENAHGQRLLAELAGLEHAPRPRAGLAGLWGLLRQVFPVSVASVAVVNAVIGALWAPLVFAIGRVLGQRVSSATLAGLVIASSPLAIHLSASELAFIPAVTALLLAVWAVAVAAKADSGWWLVAALLFVALAGHFRPVMYTMGFPVLAGVVALDRDRTLREHLGRRWLWIAVVAFAVAVADDIPGLADNLGRGTVLAPGWWNGLSLRNLPLVDPAVTPVWLVPLALVGLVATLLVRSCPHAHRALWWSLGLLAWLSFFYTPLNGWPSSLRYASSYVWVLALFIGFGVDTLLRRRAVVGRNVTAGLAVLAAVSPILHEAWMTRASAQQAELSWQRDVVLPKLAEGAPGYLVTPWPELDRMNGTLDAVEARRLGWNVVGLEQGAALLARQPAAPVLWYRALTCWVRPREEAVGAFDADGRNVRCRHFERSAPWEPVAVRLIEQPSDADWVVVGDGAAPVQVGLFRLKR